MAKQEGGMNDAPATIAHVVGNSMTFGTRTRQLCLWCGCVILDDDVATMSRPIEQPDSPPSVWTNWVEVTGVNPRITASVNWPAENDRPPENSCMFLPILDDTEEPADG